MGSGEGCRKDWQVHNAPHHGPDKLNGNLKMHSGEKTGRNIILQNADLNFLSAQCHNQIFENIGHYYMKGTAFNFHFNSTPVSKQSLQIATILSGQLTQKRTNNEKLQTKNMVLYVGIHSKSEQIGEVYFSGQKIGGKSA